MILRKLEIQGFKSFADRTEMVFGPGIIAVVGPNGSGKSNVSDAILWVLGEQNMRAIRGQKSQDVIFAGTDKRRPVGMAEVSLTVDNSSGVLPINYSEVTVTRRAYRSGESEFFINKTPCRLKDIYELFLDTGIGHEAYSIVSQGEIDAILSARPEDRRALFDEAAGIKKYRVRKKEAERRLETTEANLQRVNDVIAEIEIQIEPMAEQAEVAKRYLELVGRLREIEVGILVNDLHHLHTEMQTVKSERENVEKSLSDAVALLAALDEEKSALAVDLANAEAQVERHQARRQEAVTLVERTESKLALCNQRYLSAEQSEQLLSKEIEQLEAKIAQTKAQMATVRTSLEEAEKEESRLIGRLDQEATRLKDLEEEIKKASQGVDDEKASYIELATQLAAQRNQLANLKTRVEGVENLLAKRSAEISDALSAVERAKEDRAAAQEEVERVGAELESLAQSMAQIRANLAGKQTALRKSADTLTELNRKLIAVQSRFRALEEMEQSREGYFLGVKSVMSAVKSGKLSGEFAVVADVIRVPAGLDTAFEVALGPSLQDIITPSEREAKAAIELLKAENGGRATFLPLNMMRHAVSPLLKDLVGKNSILGLGNELLEFDKKYAPAIDALLSKVLIAQDMDSAIAVSRAAIGWSKIVTLDGEVVLPSGAVTGGRAPGKPVNLLGRKREIESLRRELEDLKAQISSAEESYTSLERGVQETVRCLAEMEDEDTNRKMALLESQRRLEFATREAMRLIGELEDLEAERDDLQSTLARLTVEVKELEAAIESANKQNADLEVSVSSGQEHVRELQDEYDKLSKDVGDLNVALASITQRRLALQESLDNLAAASTDLQEEAHLKREQLVTSKREKADAERQRAELEDQIEKARAACTKVHSEVEQWRKTKQTVVNTSMEVADRIKEISQNREQLTQKLHAYELREARVDMQISQVITRLLQDYDISAEDALSQEQPEVKYGSSAEVLRLRREIKAMGEVNTGAVQEYTRLKERYEFLTAQRQDLVEARAKLLNAIREIDESTRGIFLETFQAVGEKFQCMFERLFGGGTTELVLTQPDDILETGIDVMVEMPGKKRQNLLLLSGGERALTAAALMFALMSVRPSPFCVLDEVDAPLDETNIEKFVEVLRDFSQTSQMIVITHNRATMEAADVLYGVTMQEPGVSKMVSVRLADAVESN